MFIIKKQFYDGDDIQHILYFLNANKKAFGKFKKAIIGYSQADIDAILYAVSENYTEAFDRFDSAVGEIFLREFENCFLKFHGIPQYIVTQSVGSNFTVLDLSDNSKEVLTEAELNKAVSLGISVGGYNIK